MDMGDSMDQALELTELSNAVPKDWSIEQVGELHIIMSQMEFPTQIDVMYGQYGSEAWEVGLYVVDQDRGTMDLLSSEYGRSFDPGDYEDVYDCVREFASDISSGELDAYQAPSQPTES
jgi:hypothetical protein